jgi:DNA polymerase, archaea type
MNRYQAISEQFYGNRLLFGDQADAGVVAVEIASSSEVEVFKRRVGTRGLELVRERRPLKLFVLIADDDLMQGFRGTHEVVDLAGDFRYRHAVIFDNGDTLEAARRHLRETSGQAGGTPDAPWFALSDPVEQYLMLNGTTYFMGLQFGDLRRLQLDIETYISPGFEFPTAAREGDRIVAIALSDSDGFERVLRGDQMDERAMLEELVRIVNERDPDVIEGHNLFRFDLEYLETRSRRHRVKLALGRDGSGLRGRPSRMQIAERSIAFRRYDIYGRSIIDTWILAQHYDIASRELESFGLKDLAIHFGLARKDRVYLEAARVSEHFEQRPEELFEYALDDVRETRALAEVLSPSYFVQAQIFP